MIDPDRELLRQQVKCRQICDGDIEGVIDLLTRGFPVRGRCYWRRAFERLAKHPTPAGFPKFGYLLENNGVPVGAILLIFSRVTTGTESTIRCNISSWYVDADFRPQAPLLVLHALKHKQATYLNVSPAPHTRTTIEVQGFSRYCRGQFVALPLVSSRSESARVQSIETLARPADASLAAEFDLLSAHADLGCVSLWCTSGGESYPFVFLPRRIARGFLPVLQLVYCRDWRDFVRFAGPIGRYLACQRRFLVLMDANEPIRGLWGKYFEGIGPKYFRGPVAPRLGDLAFTEPVLFGA